MKPTVNLTNCDGNVFAVLATCTRALKDVGQKEQAKKLRREVIKAGSYEAALQIMMEYVEVQ